MTQTAANPVVDYSSTPAATGTVWTQTWGLLVDAYRELNSKKLFWVVLMLSGLVVLAFAAMGINEKGVTLLHLEFEGAWNTSFLTKAQFYKMLFSAFAIPIWLAWIATILALVSTAGIFPDMLTGGSIDLYLAKPISRLRLFLTKYLTGLLFVALQVTVFSAASVLVIGIRGGAWEPGLFLAVPLVVLLFSYLFSICVLLGILTRSTIAALLLTLLAWVMIWASHTSEQTILLFKTMQEVKQERLNETIAKNDADLARYAAATTQPEGLVKNIQFQREKSIEQRESSKGTLRGLRIAHRIAYGVTRVMPKTSETIDLLRRVLAPSVEFGPSDDNERRRRRDDDDDMRPDDPRVMQRLKREIESRSARGIIGTSLAFEAVMLTLAAWVFCRRDY